MSLDKPFLNQTKKVMLHRSTVRRDIIKYAGDALHHAKRAIFELHNGNKAAAKKKLEQSKTLFKELDKHVKKDPKMKEEGSYKAALEEYVEAVLFYNFVTTGTVGKVAGMDIDPAVYCAGLCDLPGELQRYAIRAATNRDQQTLNQCVQMGQAIIGELIEFHLTSYLRQKYDQAKKAVQKLEVIQYELSLRA